MKLEIKSGTMDNGHEIKRENSYPVNPVEKKMSDTTEIVTRLFGWNVMLPVPRLVHQRSPVWYISGPPSGISPVGRETACGRTGGT
jgi:hypothetical protein